MSEALKAISVRAPWWWLILHAGKDIENRDWPTKFRGTVYLHASKWWSMEDFNDDWESGAVCYRSAGGNIEHETTPRRIRDAGGHIVGAVDIIDCVTKSRSPWFFGDYGFVLANPVAFSEPIPCKGARGFFTVPDDVLAKLMVPSE